MGISAAVWLCRREEGRYISKGGRKRGMFEYKYYVGFGEAPQKLGSKTAYRRLMHGESNPAS
jgi:hypothetical protein